MPHLLNLSDICASRAVTISLATGMQIICATNQARSIGEAQAHHQWMKT